MANWMIDFLFFDLCSVGAAKGDRSDHTKQKTGPENQEQAEEGSVSG